MALESYEMKVSSSDSNLFEEEEDEQGEEQEEARLLQEEEEEEEEDQWNIQNGDEDNEEYIDTKPVSVLPYVVMGCSIGLFFIIFKLIMMHISHMSGHHERRAEKLYHNGTDYFASTVILISLDGFKSEYLDRDITPNLKKLGESGVKAKYMYPAFPASTFPNHWTLVTGLYPETHGIVANNFYDPELNDTFISKNDEITFDHKWWKGEPIWTTARMNRKRTGSIMWPGSNTNYNTPELLIKFNESMMPMEKMDISLNWLDLNYDHRPQLITMYIPQVDIQGHRDGPVSEEMNNVIKQVDESIGYLLEQLKQRNLDSHVHVVVVSDHGMIQTSKEKLIYYDDILSSELIQHIHREAEPLFDVRPKDTNDAVSVVDQIYQQLYNYTQSTSNAHFQVYMRDRVPERLHYSHSNRITPIVAIPDPGYIFTTRDKEFKPGGNHGYDNMDPDMRAIFLATGPKITKLYAPGAIIAPFYNVELYSFMTELLNVEPGVNNGTLNGNFPLIDSTESIHTHN